MAKLADSSLPQPPLVPGNISCAKFDPGSPERGLVIKGGPSFVLRSEIGELNAEAAPVPERDEQDRVRQAKIQLDRITPQNVAEQEGEPLASPGPDKQVDPRPEGSYLRPCRVHRPASAGAAARRATSPRTPGQRRQPKIRVMDRMGPSSILTSSPLSTARSFPLTLASERPRVQAHAKVPARASGETGPATRQAGACLAEQHGSHSCKPVPVQCSA